MIALDAAKKYKQPKEGSKEAQLREMRKAGSLPKHAGIMLDDGAPAAIIRLGKEKPAPLVSATAPSVAPKRDFRIPKGMTTEEGNAMLARLESEKKTKAYQRVNKLRESKGLPPMPTPEASASADAQKQESDVTASTAKKTKTASAKKTPTRTAKSASKSKARENARKPIGENKPSGKAEEIGKLAARENGASRAELIKLTGWEKQAWKWYFVNSKNNGFCQRFGYSLKVIDGKDGETRYKITKKD